MASPIIYGETPSQCYGHVARQIEGRVNFGDGQVVEFGLPSHKPRLLSYKAGRQLVQAKMCALGGWSAAERDSFLRYLDAVKQPLRRDEFMMACQLYSFNKDKEACPTLADYIAADRASGLGDLSIDTFYK